MTKGDDTGSGKENRCREDGRRPVSTVICAKMCMKMLELAFLCSSCMGEGGGGLEPGVGCGCETSCSG